VLIKDFEKNGVDQDSLIAVAYSSKTRETGLSIKGHKTIIVIESPLAAPEVAVKSPETATQSSAAKSSAMATPAVPAAQQAQPKPVPVQPLNPTTK